MDFVLLGLATFISTYFSAQSGHRHTDLLRLLGLVTFLTAPAFLMLRRLDWWLMNTITTIGTVMITVGIYLSGGGAIAPIGCSFYLVVLVHVFYAYPRLIAWAHVLFAAVLCVLVLHGDPLVGPAELLLGGGVAVAIAVLVSWLVRAADLAEIDYLTGLTNRRGFDRAADALLRTHSSEQPLALIAIDLDDFRAVNDRHGHAGGDDLLTALARHWRGVLPRDALASRRGGDEFAFIVTHQQPAELDHLLGQMRSGSGSTFSAGVAWFALGETLPHLLARADAAVYEAKRAGRNRTETAASFDNQTGHDILNALSDNQFALYYQPIIDLTSGVTDKAEALIRWIHPERGLIPPDDFVRRAEQTATITALGDWILSQACQDAATWQLNADGHPITVSVNASGLELNDPHYADRVAGHLARSGLTADRLVIELVETDYNTTSTTVSTNLAALVKNGVKLAIDDFGTGHSSLSRLQHTPVSILKIDRSFITPITHRDQPAPLITAILAMARALDLDVITEGIETTEQAAWLRTHGATYAQGYLYGRPAPQLPTTSSSTRHMKPSF